MRKSIILFLFLSCLHISARGQTLEGVALQELVRPTQAKALRYWFDDDGTSVQIVNQLFGKIVIDVPPLTEGLHTFHCQLIDSNDVVSSVVSKLFFKIGSNSGSEAIKASKLLYWFDDEASIQQVDICKGVQLLDASGLIEGLHTFHCQLIDSNDMVSSIVSMLFLKLGNSFDSEAIKARKLLYWFDDEATIQQADVSDDIQVLDASELTEGLHAIHYQVLCNNGQMTSAVTSLFFRISADSGTTPNVLRYWFDDEKMAEEVAISKGNQMLDASRLTDGLHAVHYQLVNMDGTLGIPSSSLFFKFDTSMSLTTAKNIRYWFDDDATSMKMIEIANGLQSIDVSALPMGLHSLNYQMIDDSGNVGIPMARLFMKLFNKTVENGKNRITKYRYWLNDKCKTTQTVAIEDADNPYTLYALLPMQHESIRSSLFDFEITANGPVLYAKNEIHMRFYDASGSFWDAQKLFVDESVKQEVTDVTLLNPGERKTSGRPEENAIKWYKVTAVRGDSLAFKTDYPCTIQLFSPSGVELYNVSGPDAVRFGGSYAPEDGTYYLALHDVTAQNGSTLTVDYQHIDKYAVLSYTPEEIGVTDSYVYVSLDGNGFDKLISADLVLGDFKIEPENIGTIGKSKATLKFILNGEEQHGNYDFELKFKDGDENETLLLNEAIKLTTPTWNSLKIDVALKRSTARPYPVTVSVTNTGNAGLLYVPFNIAYDNADAIEQVDFETFFIKIGESAYQGGYSPLSTVENFLDRGVRAKVLSMFIPSISPGETMTFRVGFTAPDHHKFNLYAWTGDPLNYNSEQPDASIPSLVDYLAFANELKEEEIALSRRRAPRTVNVNVVDVAQRVGDNAVYTGRLMGNIVNGTAHYSDMERLKVNNIDPDDPLYEEIENLHVVQSPSQIFDDEQSSYHWFARLWERQRQSCQNSSPQAAPHPVDTYNPGDPNDILGYMSESGSKYMKEGTADVYYTIEFENDPEIANASAHTIVVKDTLDKSRFDLSTFAATGVKIGSVEMKLDGEKNFSKKTMDLRPAIDVIAQVSLSLDEQQGIATWTIESLDPMSLEPTEDAMQGVLPVNVNGNGQGELMFDIKLKPGMTEGETVSNRAGIVFDQEGTIMTPSWVNTVDATDPESHVENVAMACDDSVSVKVTATDALSKPWRYDLYVQEGSSGIWQRKAANIPVDSLLRVKVVEGIDYGFYTIVTDSAGNVEQKEAQREFTFEVFGSQIDTNTKIDLAAGWNWISHNQQEPLTVDALKPASARMQSQTEDLYEDTHFGWMGDLTELLPTQMYKVQMGSPLSVQLSGRLFNAGFRSVPLYVGWNWLGYPVANTMSPAEALQKLEAEEGDMLIGQDGLTTYSEGQWTGTLLEMVPGLGYMYRSASDKNLFYNATAQASSRRANSQLSTLNSQLPEGWTVDKRKYPNVMGVIAVLMQDETAVEVEQWVIGAFCGAECRGISKEVSGTLMMNVYGQGGEPIRFYAMNCETGEVLPVAETEPFEANVLGTMLQPYALHIGEPTGISQTEDGRWMTDDAVYDLQGRKVDGMQMKKGIYVTSDRNRSKTQKVIRR